MNRHNFPFIALAISVPLALALLAGGQLTTGADGERSTGLPLLTLLAIGEFGLLVNLIAAGLSVQRLIDGGWDRGRAAVAAGCAIFSLAFLSQLIRWWPL